MCDISSVILMDIQHNIFRDNKYIGYNRNYQTSKQEDIINPFHARKS